MQVRMTLPPGIINYCSSLSYKHGSFVFWVYKPNIFFIQLAKLLFLQEIASNLKKRKVFHRFYTVKDFLQTV